MKIESFFSNKTKWTLALCCGGTLIAGCSLFYYFFSPFAENDNNSNSSDVEDKLNSLCSQRDGKKQSETTFSPEESEKLFRLATNWKVSGNECFQKGEYNEALAAYEKSQRILSLLSDEKSLKQFHLVGSNMLMCLYKLRLFFDACQLATSLLESESPLENTVKAKILYRRALSSAAIGEKEGAIMDLKASIYFSPDKKNVEAERELKQLIG